MPENQPQMGLCEILRADLRRFVNGGSIGWLAMAACLFLRTGFLAVAIYRLSAACAKGGALRRALAKVLWRLNVFISGCDISPRAVIGAGFKMSHPCGVVIGPAVIGSNVMMLQNTTLGLRRFSDDEDDPKNYPVVGDNVIICAGAVLAGSVKVGSNVVIGANAVVTSDVPDDSTAIGVPARLVPRGHAKPV